MHQKTLLRTYLSEPQTIDYQTKIILNIRLIKVNNGENNYNFGATLDFLV